ncbi:MAG: zinc ribbon domain-containing protein [Eubacteriales bacterium]|nr:zinc ribbon domain-containing protein [Eubacteriales bacterium]
MKYCPYCGAVLLDSAVSFCSECGKALPGGESAQSRPGAQTAVSAETEASVLPEEAPGPVVAAEDTSAVEQSVSQKKSASRKKRKKAAEKARSKKKSGRQDQQPEDEKPEEDYDGYYNDILPVDEGRLKEGMDQQLVQKIIVLAVSALLVVGACVAMMYLL